MTPEEYERFKEAEKEHLRALKKLKETARGLRRQQSINRALGDMAGAIGGDEAYGTHEEMLDKLAMDTARQEARMEIALENTKRTEETPATPTRKPEQLEEDLLKERAQTLLKQMKLQMGMTDPTDAPEEAARPPAPDAADSKPSPPAERPEKTIGRMK